MLRGINTHFSIFEPPPGTWRRFSLRNWKKSFFGFGKTLRYNHGDFLVVKN